MFPDGTLYIIGNGFDIHHGVPSRYADFASWLRVRNREVLDWLETTCRVDFLWQEFERALAYVNRGHFLEMGMMFIPNNGFPDDDFSGAEFFMPSDYINGEADNQWKEINKAFRKWISTIRIPADYDKKKIYLDYDAHFINFNYTRCLETHYGIDDNQILYIHGNAVSKKFPPIIGHDYEDDGFDQWYNSKMGKHYRRFYTGKNFHFLPEIESITAAAEEFGTLSEKPVRKIIEQYRDYFNDLYDITHVYVLGHSLAKVDLPYFREVINVSDYPEEITWHVSYYNPEEKPKFEEALTSIGVKKEQIQFFRLSEIQINR